VEDFLNNVNYRAGQLIVFCSLKLLKEQKPATARTPTTAGPPFSSVTPSAAGTSAVSGMPAVAGTPATVTEYQLHQQEHPWQQKEH
jgi:hypothetical protein